MPGFQCQICSVNLNSHEQLTQHRNGAKHFKKMKEKGLDPKKETDTVPLTESKLYGKFVPASSDGKVDLCNRPLFPPPPPPPPKCLIKTEEPQSQGQSSSSGPSEPRPESSPPPPPPPRNVIQPREEQTMPTQGPMSGPRSGMFTGSGPRPSMPAKPQSNSLKRPRNPGPLKANPKDDFDIQDSDKIFAEKIEQLPGINPVMKAVMNNALGNLPLKRKAYNGRCDACGLDFNAESQERQHFDGKKHAKRMRMLSFESSDVSPSVVRATGFNCQFCDVTLNSLDQLEQHRSGTKHQKRVKAIQIETKTSS